MADENDDDEDDDETQERQPLEIDDTETENKTSIKEIDSEVADEKSEISQEEDDVMKTMILGESPCKCNSDKVSSRNSNSHSAEAENETKRCQIFTRNELIEYFENLKRRKCPEKDRIVVGMVGFPNVGKSSTINALLGDKKTSVSATPGKTKHFQV